MDYTNIEAVKAAISNETGVPAVFLTGETEEENRALAQAVLDYKRDHEATAPQSAPKDAKSEFVAWLNGDIQPEPMPAPTPAPNYPTIQDGGEPHPGSTTRTAKEQFEDMAARAFAFDPRKEGNWHKL